MSEVVERVKAEYQRDEAVKKEQRTKEREKRNELFSVPLTLPLWTHEILEAEAEMRAVTVGELLRVWIVDRLK